MFGKKQQKRVYFDWAAASPLSKDVHKAMQPWLEREWGNPSAIHREGQRAKNAIEESRSKVAAALQVRPEFVTFTSGGTEANNLAIMGTVMNLRASYREFSDMEIVTTKIEHPSILATIDALTHRGVVVRYVRVHETGLIDLKDFAEKITEKTILCSFAYANSEIGTVQHLHAIKKTIRAAEEQFKSEILLHVDAAQAPLWLSCQFDTVGADLLTLDAGKCCGPKGVGFLIRSRRAELTPYLFGGGQESGLRPGTENVPGIAGASVALVEVQKDWRSRQEHVRNIRDEAISHLLTTIPGAVLNGAVGEDRIANNINISIPNIDTEYATVVLDTQGFAVSTKSACSGAGGGESAVVREISGDPTRAAATLRITFGPDVQLSELKNLTSILAAHVTQMSGLTQK